MVPIAADRAEEVSALLEAIENLDEAIGISSPDAAADLRLRRGRLRGRTGDHRGARADLDESLRAAVERGDRSLEMRCHDEIGFLVAGAADYRGSVEHLERALALADELGDATGRVSALSRLTITWANRAQLDRAQRSGELALEAASASGDERLLAVALDALKLVALLLGRLADVERYGDELRRMYARRNDRWLEQFVDLETAYASIAGCRFDEARRRLDRALTTNRELHDDGNEPLIIGTFAPYHRCRGELDAAIGIGRRALVLARERGHAEWIASTASQLGATLLQAGAGDEAVEVLREGVDAAERSGADMHDLRCSGLLVRALARREHGRDWRELLGRPRPSSQPSTSRPASTALRLGRRRRHRRRPAGPVRREAGARDDRVDRRRVLGTVVAGGGRRRLTRPGTGAGRTRRPGRRARGGAPRPTSGPIGTASASTPGAPRPLSPRSSRTAPLRDRRRPGQAVGGHVARLDHRR